MNMFSQRFKELRKKIRMTQVEIAEVLHTSAQNISRWENGESEPNIDMILDITKLFKVSSDYLFGKDINSESIILSDIFRYVKNMPKDRQIESIKNMCKKSMDAMFASIFGQNEDEIVFSSSCTMANTEYGICLNSYGETEDEKRLPMFAVFSKSDAELAREYIKPNAKYRELFEALADEDTFGAILKIYSSEYTHKCGFDVQSLEKELELNDDTFEKVLKNLEKYGFIHTKEVNGLAKINYPHGNMRMMCIIYMAYSFLFNNINGNI